MLIAIDLGNSQNRVVYDKNGMNKIISTPNYFVELLKGVETAESEKPQDVFIINQVEGTNEFVNFSDYVIVTGKTAEIQYANRIQRPNYFGKPEQKNTYYSIITSIVRCMDAVDILTDTINLTSLLPLEEVGTKSDILIKNLCGRYTVKYNNKKFNFQIQIKKQSVLGECQAAILASFYNVNLQVDTAMERYIDGNSIAFDIGAGTINIAAFNNLSFIKNSKKTIYVGGNTVRSQFIDLVSKVVGYNPSEEAAEIACQTGNLRAGIENIDVTKYVNQARQIVAQTAITHIKSHLAKIQLNLTEVKACFYLGGNSIVNKETPELKSLGLYIQELLLPITQYSTHIFVSSPRIKNVEGAYIHAKLQQI